MATTYLLLKYAHLIAFVYWLGGDLGTFFGSRATVRTDISPEARGVALKIMLACDQGPKLAMPLIFPLGLQMANNSGLTHLPPLLMTLVWLVAAVWVGNVLYLYYTANQAGKARIASIDLAIRIAAIVVISAYALAGLANPELIAAPWLAYKMLIFAVMVGCGVAIRLALKPFVPAFVKLLSEGASDAVNNTLSQSLARAKPWVYVIWLGLFTNAAIGLHLF